MSKDADSRRAFWTASMDAADAFMRQVAAYPVEECGEPMVSLIDSAAEANVEVVFSNQLSIHRQPRQFFLRAGLVSNYLAAAAEMNERGWVLRVEDAYRTMDMQRTSGVSKGLITTVLKMVQWESGEKQPPVDLLWRRLGALVANAPKVGTHMSGSAIDIGVLDRDSGEELDRGGPYVDLSERTPMDSPFISEEAQRNRQVITALMARNGLLTYPWEFWHYNGGDAYEALLKRTGQPARYGAVHMAADGSVTVIENPCELLNPTELIGELMEEALAEA